MKQAILLIIATLISTTAFTQDTTKITIDDALYFLNKKFKENSGIVTMKTTSYSDHVEISNIEVNIESVSLRPDSVMVINTSMSSPREPNKYIYYIKLSEVTLVQYKKIKIPLVNDKYWKSFEYLKYNEHTYSILSLKEGAIKNKYLRPKADFPEKKSKRSNTPSQTLPEFVEHKDFNFSQYLTSDESSEQIELNELATRMSNAFNFIIKAYGGGKTGPKEREEKF